VSSLADATLHLQGSQSNLLLGGDVLITRFSVSPTWTSPPCRAGQRRPDHRAA